MTGADVKLGYIGLGNMGAPMARRLTDWPGGLAVFDVRDEAMAPLVEAGAHAAESVDEVAGADIISVTVLDDAQVREVVGTLAPKAKPGTIIAIHSTIGDTTAVDLAEQWANSDVRIVDAPVSGGAGGAQQGVLATMVGADAETFARLEEPFARWASLVVHAGPVGAGTRMKLARNLLHFVAFTAVGEAQRLAESYGLDLMELGKVVRHTDGITGGPGAIMLRDTGAAVPADSFWYPILTHVRDLGEKDLSLALALGRERSVDLPLATLARDRLAVSLGVPHEPKE